MTTMARTVTVTFEDGTQHVYQNAPDNITPEQVSQRAAEEFGKPVKALDGGRPSKEVEKEVLLQDLWRAADQTFRGGVLAFPGFMGDMYVAGSKKAGNLPTPLQGLLALQGRAFKKLGVGENGNPMPSEALQTITGGKIEKPEDPTLRSLANIGETVVSTMTGGGGITKAAMRTKAAIGAGSGVGAETSARLFGDNAVSRVAGGLIGGFAPTVAGKYVANSENLLRQATSQIPDADWRRAKVLEKTLTQSGIPHLKSQTLGDKSTLADLVAVASTHPAVRPKLVAAVENAPEQSRKAFELWKNTNLPVAVDETKSVLSDVQKAASGQIANLKGQANAAYTRALPPGVSAAEYTPKEVRTLATNLRTLAADPAKFGPLSAGGRFINGLADDVEAAIQPGKLLGPNGKPLEVGVKKGYINNLLKDLNTRAEKEGYKGLSMDEVKTAIKAATPEFEAARAAKTTVMTGKVNPAQQGLMGQLAQMGGGVRPDRFTAKETALNIVFPKDVRQPEAIIRLGKDMGGEGVGELLREHLGRSMERAVKLTTEAGKPQQPFHFVQEIAGTNAQRQNLEAALKVTAESMGANPAAVRNGFYKLMRAFESTKDLKLPASVDRAVLQQQAGLNVPGLLVAPQSRLGRVLWERATAKTFNQIADIVMSPDGLKKLEEIAKSQKPAVAEAYARSILTSALQADPEPQPAP